MQPACACMCPSWLFVWEQRLHNRIFALSTLMLNARWLPKPGLISLTAARLNSGAVLPDCTAVSEIAVACM